ncbi:PEThy ZPT4-2 [Hibiscus syriacus]|uniref:PEThy ZPT4-2 n=1 Tax=Hibiscus syriacus TaxID=106335 RepID=A0A6A3BSB0_HIBSY|nr:pentatricopeptide repeat-containing protein At2g20540-like [Hibiscus syriacus]KAE8719800.1 PEThy ZPT4-2 [Hibiscus syriacus]
MSSSSKRCLKLLEKCKNMKQLSQAHAQAITCGLGTNTFALSRLLAFCSNPEHGSLTYACNLFKHIHEPTICICNTMIKAIFLKGETFETLQLYSTMLSKGMYPDNYTLPFVLKACAKLQFFYSGELIYGHCLKLGFVFDTFVGNALMSMHCGFNNVKVARCIFDEIPRLDVVSWTVMISGYVQMGDIETARLLFNEAPVKDRGIWGAMISGYVKNNCFKESLYMFRLMQMSDVEPDEAIFVSVISACANMGALDSGIWIHKYMDHHQKFPLSLRLSTCLVDMYAKCGNLDIAKKLFDEMQQRDVVSWNVMISGLAMHGDGESAIQLFRQMEKDGVRPDDITFIALFSACSYSGNALEGLRILDRMRNVHNIEPKSEHFGCIIDLLVRGGLFEEANQIIQTMPDSSNPSDEAIAWRALLSSYCSSKQTKLAEVAAEKLMQLEDHSGVYVLLSNLYASFGKHYDAKRIKQMMKSRGVNKAPGCSSIKINGEVHEFIAGENSHLQMEEIYLILEKLDKQLHYTGPSPYS